MKPTHLGQLVSLKDYQVSSSYLSLSFPVVDTAKIKAPEGQGCPRCGGAVFAAELVLAKGREWHRKCFKCFDCRTTLDSINACDGPTGEVFCRSMNSWICLSLLVLVTDFFAPQLAMESVGDLTVMVLLVVQDFCKLTEPREFLKLLSVPFN